MSAGADEPGRAAARVGVITSIGYVGFLGGPPFIGLLAREVHLLHALIVVVILLVASSPAVRWLSPTAAPATPAPGP